MHRLRAYYDNYTGNYRLNWAIAFTVIFTINACIGVSQLAKYFYRHDGYYLLSGGLSIVIGIAGVLHGAQIIHAVVRRAAAQSPSSH